VPFSTAAVARNRTVAWKSDTVHANPPSRHFYMFPGHRRDHFTTGSEPSGQSSKRGLGKKLGRAALALSGVSLTLLSRRWRGPRARPGSDPGTPTLNLIQTDLSGPVAHALVTSAFVGSGVLYATGGGHGPGVSRLAAAGLGGAAALGAVQVMGWLFPDSPMLF
jgi:hypothetical protein